MNALIQRILATRPCNWSPAPLRLAAGLVFIGHGSQKLFGWFGGPGLKATAQFFSNTLHLSPGVFWAGLAGCGEFFGGLGLLFGLATRFFGLVNAVTMVVAILTAHISKGFFAQGGGFEYPLTLLLVMLSLMVSGGGACSIDALLAGKSCRSGNTPLVPAAN